MLSFVNFADEDLTDKILEMFDTGDDEQKAYAALYFYHINDPLALEYLEKYAFSDYGPLAQNCAKSLKQFGNKKLYNQSINIIKNKDIDDFEKAKYVNFLTAYNDKAVLDNLFDYLKNTYMKSFAAESILYLTTLNDLANTADNFSNALYVFDIILSSYPEEISLETIFDFDILNFVKYLANCLNANKDTYIKRLLLKAKYKFNLFAKEEIYTFDLVKQTKNEIFAISNFINKIEFDLFDNLENELFLNDRERILEALNVISTFGKTNFSSYIAKMIDETNYEDAISEGVRILKTFGQLNLLNSSEVLTKIKNENLLAITESYFK